MAISLFKVMDSHVSPLYRHYHIDYDDDIENLPGLDECCVGSTALSAESGTQYIIGSDGEWVVDRSVEHGGGGGGAELYFKSATGLDKLFYIDNEHIQPTPMPPKEIYINAPNCKTMVSGVAQYINNQTYQNGIEKITLNIYTGRFDASSFAKRNTTIKEIVFTAPVVNLNATLELARDATALETITGELSFALWNRSSLSGNFEGATSLKNVRISAGCIKYNATFSSAVLTDDSLVSIANALSDTVTGMTLTHHATAKARCGQIVGTVADGVFTQDAGGTVTLTDFITQSKGWTLA